MISSPDTFASPTFPHPPQCLWVHLLSSPGFPSAVHISNTTSSGIGPCTPMVAPAPLQSGATPGSVAPPRGEAAEREPCLATFSRPDHGSGRTTLFNVMPQPANHNYPFFFFDLSTGAGCLPLCTDSFLEDQGTGPQPAPLGELVSRPQGTLASSLAPCYLLLEVMAFCWMHSTKAGPIRG